MAGGQRRAKSRVQGKGGMKGRDGPGGQGRGQGQGGWQGGEAGYSQGTSGGGLAGSILMGARGAVLLLVRDGTLAGRVGK